MVRVLPVERERIRGYRTLKLLIGGLADRFDEWRTGVIACTLGSDPTTMSEKREQKEREVRELVAALVEPGETLPLKGSRGGAVQTWQVTVGELPAVNEFRG